MKFQVGHEESFQTQVGKMGGERGDPMRWSPLNFGSMSEWVRRRLSPCRSMVLSKSEEGKLIVFLIRQFRKKIEWGR